MSSFAGAHRVSIFCVLDPGVNIVCRNMTLSVLHGGAECGGIIVVTCVV